MTTYNNNINIINYSNNNNQNQNNNELKSSDQYDFNFKKEFLKRIGLINNRNEEEYENFVIEDLNDIAQLQILFCQQVPLENINSQFQHTLESVIERILIKQYGGLSTHLNIIFALFLNELGIDCKLVKINDKSKFNNISFSNSHYTIIIEWSDGNQYLIDVGLGIYNCYQPLKLSSVIPKLHSSMQYRVRKIKDGSYIYEEKSINEHIYNPIFQFNKQKNNSTLDEILNISNNNNNINNNSISNYNNNNNNNNQIYIFKLNEKGYYYIKNNKFFIKNYYNDKKNNEITITDINQFKKISLKYFNILIK